ncbi:hypothetical protein A5789_21780 [Nocardia sp. 852002-51101_SCH5132738]|nr:hypothetical protein A5789_21780 [Nocardia sp. 852002-51101_SCH5132738]OBB47944.1 hypothetical protein A5748_22175 [Nocardia sp. 852002-51244_SCH5132740]OBF80736.1 hypothetical protein A9X06_20805 [Mycobacterium sp. 852002-51759_SCH5129042]
MAAVKASNAFFRQFAAQLGQPSGLSGRLIGHLLNKANSGPVNGSLDALAAAPGTTVADIGFGGGRSLSVLLDQVGETGVVYGIDPSRTVIAGARRRYRRAITRGRLRLEQASMSRIPLPDNALDGAATINTVYYIPDVELIESLQEVARVLRPGGRLVVGLGDTDYLRTLPWQEGMLLRPLTEVTEFIAAAGMTITDHRRVGSSWRAFHVYTAVR